MDLGFIFLAGVVIGICSVASSTYAKNRDKLQPKSISNGRVA